MGPRVPQPNAPPRYRPLLLPAGEFALGVAAREFVGGPPALLWAAWFVAAGGCVLAARRRGRLALLFIHALCVLTGWARLDLEVRGKPQDCLSRGIAPGEGIFVRLKGTVASEPEVQVLPPRELSGDSSWLSEPEERTRFRMAACGVFTRKGWRKARARIQVVLHAARRDLRRGNNVEAIGRLVRPGRRRNPGGLDSAAFMRRRAVELTLSLQPEGLRSISVGRPSLSRFVASVRRFIARQLFKTLGRRASAMLQAVLVGDRERLKQPIEPDNSGTGNAAKKPTETSANSLGVKEELAELFKRTGTMHLLAISGFHVGVVAWVVWRLAALARTGRRTSGLITLTASWAYILIAGAPPSAVRAGAMLSVYLLGFVGKRQFDLPQGIAAAALVVLAIRPYELFDVGFQLSFLAVLSIVCLTEDFYVLLRPRERLIDRLLGEEGRSRLSRLRRWLHSRAAILIAVSAAAWLGVFPLSASYFNLVSPIGIVMNLAAVPLVAGLVVLGWLHLAIGWIPWLGTFSAGLVDAVGWLLTGTVGLVAHGRVGWTYCTTPTPLWIAAYYVLGLVIVARRRLGLSGKRAAMFWLAGVAFYLGWTLKPSVPEGLEMTVLDVGHGSANVLRFPDGHVMLFDCGSYGRDDIGRWVAAPALWAKDVRRIDLIVVSHADADHINGIPALLGRFPVGRVFYSPVIEDSHAGQQLIEMLDRFGVPHQPARAGDRVRLGESTIEVLGPTDWTLRNLPHDQNDNSLVARVEYRGRRILLTGDIRDPGATVLLRSGQDVRADVLVVPHHGHKMARTEEFARAVAPSFALISNRADRLPQETVTAYRAAGARVLSTGDHGALTVSIRNGRVGAEPFLGGGAQAGNLVPPKARAQHAVPVPSLRCRAGRRRRLARNGRPGGQPLQPRRAVGGV